MSHSASDHLNSKLEIDAISKALQESDPLTSETIELLQAMIRNRCVNDGDASSGQEKRNAETLATFLEGCGADVRFYEPMRDRVSLVARLYGANHLAPSLCLMGHTDVVPVDEEGWSRDPFGGELVNGEVWGRGAVDMLNMTASMAVAFKTLAERKADLFGDLTFFAVADEESGGKFGAEWITNNEPEAVRSDYVLTEEGGLHIFDNGKHYLGISVAEKGVAWRRLRVRGTPGHGSHPWRSDNALVRGAQVISRLAAYKPPAVIDDLWQLRVRSLQISEDIRRRLLDAGTIDDALAFIMDTVLASDLHAASHLTLSPNALKGEMKINTIPGTVEVLVDVRTLPDQDSAYVNQQIENALGDLADYVEIDPVLDTAATSSSTDNKLWESLHKAARASFTDIELLPQLIVGATDARFFRRMKSVAYGAGLFSPELDADDYASRFHGNDERIDIESLRLTTGLWLEVAKDLLF